MIQHRRRQRTFADGFITEEVDDLWEPWMRQADEVLQDEELLNLVQQELVKRCRKSKTRGRPSRPQRKWLYGCCCSNTFATGVMRC